MEPSTHRRAEFAAGLAFGAVLLLAAALLWPGATGGFRFDDYPNLGGLTALRADPGPGALAQFLAGGIASPLGRPLALASFAAQVHSWPVDAAAFIEVNILLHLLAGALLLWWLLRLARLLEWAPRPAAWVPMAAAALWLVAPIQLTTVLYVVQRMTGLAALCVFLGLLLYTVGRARAAAGRRGGRWWMSAGLAVGAGLGTLAKETALLMPLLVAVLECTLLARVPRPAAWRPWAWAFLALPAAVVVGYLLWVAAVPGPHYAGREFTLGERLLTEPRVLFLYLYKLLLPWPSAMRLWYDDFTLSTGLLQPWTTLAALAGWAALLAAAWRWRASAPMFAFAVLWFVAAHLLESTTLPLEPVFEHRNYVAGAGVWLALAAGAQALLARASGPLPRNTGLALGAAYFALLAAVSHQVAVLWGKPFEQTVWMAERLPDSRRATQELVGALILRGRAGPPVELARAAAARWPDDPSFPLQQLAVSCQVGGVAHPPAEDLLRRIATLRHGVNTVVHHLDQVLSLAEQGHCPAGTPLPLSRLTAAAVGNGALRGQRQNRLLLHARALRLEGRRDEAREAYDRAIDAAPKMILVLHGAITALGDGDGAAARAYLERAESDPRIRRLDRLAYGAEVAQLRRALDGGRTAPPSR
jgi:hypothetical protein